MAPRTSRDDTGDDAEFQGGKRPIWSGSIGFGIVNIPVKMYPAVRQHDLHFHQISRTDRKRIRYLKVADGTTDEVPADDIIKGFQMPDGSYVVFDADELERIAARKSRVIEIDAFVDLADIDPRHFNRPYYLKPASEAALKPYRLLVEVLERSARVGIAQIVMHNKEHLVAIRSLNGTLCLETLHFSDELVDPDDLGDPARKVTVGEREIKVAEQLVESLSTSFDAQAYRDEHLERLRAAIRQKAKGKTLLLDEPEAEQDDGKVLDLMEALKRSVERTKARKKVPASKAAAKPKNRRAG